MQLSSDIKNNRDKCNVVASNLIAHLGIATSTTLLCQIKQWEILHSKKRELVIMLNTIMCKNCIYHFSNNKGNIRENNCMCSCLVRLGIK